MVLAVSKVRGRGSGCVKGKGAERDSAVQKRPEIQSAHNAVMCPFNQYFLYKNIH